MKKTISFSYAGVPVITYALIGVTSVVLGINLIMMDDNKKEEDSVLPGLGMMPQTVSTGPIFEETSEPPISSPFNFPSEPEEEEEEEREPENENIPKQENIPEVTQEKNDENTFGGKIKKNGKKRTIQKKRKNNKKSRKIIKIN